MTTNKGVSQFLDELQHPFREGIDLLCIIILETNENLSENIKWNAPNYHFSGEDRFTMRIQPPKNNCQLILHRGAKKQEQLGRLIDSTSKLLQWKENDRAVITFNSLEEIESRKEELSAILNAWLQASK
jgi:hypothetical protein